MNRRAFVKVLWWGSLAVASGLSVVGLSGCSAGSVFAAILSWVSKAGPAAFKAIITLLGAAGVVLTAPAQVIVGEIFTGFTDLENAVIEYQSTTPPPVGALAKIDTVLTDLMNNFQGFLNNIPVVGPIILVAVSIAEVIISTIAGFIMKLPASVATGLPKATNRLKVPFRHGGKTLSVAPMVRSNRKFAQDVNAPIDAAATAGTISKLTAKEAHVPVPLF